MLLVSCAGRSLTMQVFCFTCADPAVPITSTPSKEKETMCLSCLSGMLLRNVTVMLYFYHLYRCDPAVQTTSIPLRETNVFIRSFSPLDL